MSWKSGLGCRYAGRYYIKSLPPHPTQKKIFHIMRKAYKSEHNFIFACVYIQSLQSCLTVCNPLHCSPYRFLCPWGVSRHEYWSRLPFPPPGEWVSNPFLLHCRQILYPLSHLGSPVLHLVLVKRHKNISQGEDEGSLQLTRRNFFWPLSILELEHGVGGVQGGGEGRRWDFIIFSPPVPLNWITEERL